MEHAARIYPTNVAAAQALGTNPPSFRRLCLELGIEPPSVRTERQLRKVRQTRG